MKKRIVLIEGEASLTLPDGLSIESCDKLQVWFTGLMGEATARAMIQKNIADLQASAAAHVANDDDGPK